MGIYDARRDLFIFTDTAKLQVLSKSAGKWLTPIALPSTSSKTQLIALAESPDGSKLAVSDYGGQAIYVLNPNAPASAVRYPMPIDFLNTSLIGPSGIAVTNSGVVYFAGRDIGGQWNSCLLQTHHRD